MNHFINKFGSRLVKQVQETGSAVLTQANNNEFNYLYGGEGYAFADRKQFIGPNLIGYNQAIPYYNFANSLAVYYPNRNDPRDYRYVHHFLISGILHPHGQMHNYLGNILNHSLFSITNPLFMVFHAYVDYMLELFLRNTRKSGYGWQLDTAFSTMLIRDRTPVIEWIDKGSGKNYYDVSYDEYRNLMCEWNINGPKYVRYSDNLSSYFKSPKQTDFHNTVDRLPILRNYTFNYTFDLIVEEEGKRNFSMLPPYLKIVYDTIKFGFDNKVGKHLKKVVPPLILFSEK